MSTRIKTEIAIGIILLVVILIGGIVWFNSKIPNENRFSAVPVAIPNTNSDQNTINSSDYISNELQKLKIQPTGPKKQLQLQLPATLSDANWGMKKIVCAEGGYDLSSYAGKTLTFTSFPISETDDKEPLNVWVISDEKKVVCVYEAVSENSQSMPGIFPVGKAR